MKKSLCILSLALCASACNSSDVKSTLGLKKHSPDEFMVLSRPALTVPPSFDLPEPQTANISAPKDFSANAAKQVVFGTPAATATATKATSKKLATAAKKESQKQASAETTFLSKAGVTGDQSDIRKVLNEDAQAEEERLHPVAEQDAGFFSRLFSPIQLEDKPDPIVNPTAEKQRIKDQQASGEKVDGSDTQIIQPKGETVLDHIKNIF